MNPALVILFCLVVAFLLGIAAAGRFLKPAMRLMPNTVRNSWFATTTVMPGMIGIRLDDGKISRELGPGRYRRFDPFGQSLIVVIPTSPTAAARVAVDLLSKDQFSLRATLVPMVRVVDAQAYLESAPLFDQVGGFGMPAPATLRFDSLADRLSAAATALAGGMTLEEIVAGPAALAEKLKAALADSTPGTLIEEVLVSGVTVPPEVRKMFTEVERARREGLAQLERARSEQAALRALANAARSLASNPQLAQLRLLQAMEGAKGQKTFVLGQSLFGTENSIDPASP